MSNSFYELTADQWFEFTKKEVKTPYLLLECQPYGSRADTRYRIVTGTPIPAFTTFKDRGRTEGWWQCLLGVGVHKTGGKIKLPKEAIAAIDKLPPGFVAVDKPTWAEIVQSLGSIFEPDSNTKQTGENNGE